MVNRQLPWLTLSASKTHQAYPGASRDHGEIHYFHLPLSGRQMKNNQPPAGQCLPTYYADANIQVMSKTSRSVAFFPFCPPPPRGMRSLFLRGQQKGKRNRKSASFAPQTTLSSSEEEPRWSGISAMLRYAVKEIRINACGITCCRENGNDIMLPVLIKSVEDHSFLKGD
jgi:hypothetical protein